MGEPWPNDLPPARVGPFWIPECCGLFQDVPDGGMEIGGEVGDVFNYPEPTAGGMEIGGSAGDVYRPPDATEGGMEIGGSAGDVYTPPPPSCPTPTTTCAAAPAGALGTVCTVTPPDNTTVWRRWDTAPGHGYWLEIGSTVGTVVDYYLYEGADCSSLTLLTSGSTLSVLFDFHYTATAAHAWVKWVPRSPADSASSLTSLTQTS